MLLRLENVHKSFGKPESRTYRNVLSGVDLDLEEGKSMAIVGPSGSGKSTLLNIIGTLDKASEGHIFFNGASIDNYSEKEQTEFRNKEIGFVFQSHHLLPQCNVLENVLVPTLPYQDKKQLNEQKQSAQDLIKKVALWDQRFDYPGTLSGGECQRVAVIRSLINQPRLILADEPTGSLDQDNANDIVDLLLRLKDDFRTSLIVVTHSDEIATKMDDGYRLIDGQLQLVN